MGKHKIDDMVKAYQNTNDENILNEIIELTRGLIYSYGKSFNIPKSEFNYLFGLAITKALKKWNENGQASFTTYLSTIIYNELRLEVRSNQSKFEKKALQENEAFKNIPSSSDFTQDIIYEILVNDIINSFPKKATRKALRMYCDGYLIQHIVDKLGIGRTNFYADLKEFKRLIMEVTK